MMLLVLIAFTLILGGFVFFVLPQAKADRRILSVGVFLLLTLLVYGGAIELLGHPKPMRLEWRDITKAQGVGALPIENEAIYLWLATPGSHEPRAYALPWDEKAAQQLQDAMNAAEVAGTAVEMALPSGGGRDVGGRMFWARPLGRLTATGIGAGRLGIGLVALGFPATVTLVWAVARRAKAGLKQYGINGEGAKSGPDADQRLSRLPLDPE